MNKNDINKIINYFINIFNKASTYDMFNDIDNVLLLSDSNNQSISKFMSFVLNNKNGCIATSDVFSNVNDSKLKVYSNIMVMDQETEEFIKSKNINARIYNINQLIQNNIGNFEMNRFTFVMAIISLGLVVYYNENASEVIERIIEMVNNFDIQNIKRYEIIVCNELINIGLGIFKNDINSISFISFIDQNKYYKNALFIGNFSEHDKKAIDETIDNKDIETCEFNDDIEQIIYGMLLGIHIGG